MEFNHAMLYNYLNENPASHYVVFATRPRTKLLNAYLISRDSIALAAEKSPNLFDGGTDGVPRIKLLQAPTFERCIRSAGGKIEYVQEFNFRYEDINVGKNGTRSAALEAIARTVITGYDPAAIVVADNSTVAGSADIMVKRADGTEYYVEVKCRLGRFNVNSAEAEENVNSDATITWAGGCKSITVARENVDTIINILHMEGYNDSDIIIR